MKSFLRCRPKNGFGLGQIFKDHVRVLSKASKVTDGKISKGKGTGRHNPSPGSSRFRSQEISHDLKRFLQEVSECDSCTDVHSLWVVTSDNVRFANESHFTDVQKSDSQRLEVRSATS